MSALSVKQWNHQEIYLYLIVKGIPDSEIFLVQMQDEIHPGWLPKSTSD